ncbi:DUF3631 domain-containing protein [Streptomyces sp. NPDC093589]|uniref:DUF3631 domain-containing protein n=1 Tax=Streptomyces sp. NPDC093589 TaxID=3366043 RepID=UPI003803CA5E
MTTFPTLLDALSTTLMDEQPKPENPQHRALLDTFTEIQALDARLVAWAEAHPDEKSSADEQLESLIDLLVERLAAGYELSRLLSTTSCSDNEAEDVFLSCPPEETEPQSVVHAALEVFTAIGEPETMTSADLVLCMRDLPGNAAGHWRYEDLTQTTLAHVLAPYGVSTQNVTHHDGRRLKSYRHSDLLAALPD